MQKKKNKSSLFGYLFIFVQVTLLYKCIGVFIKCADANSKAVLPLFYYYFYIKKNN